MLLALLLARLLFISHSRAALVGGCRLDLLLLLAFLARFELLLGRRCLLSLAGVHLLLLLPLLARLLLGLGGLFGRGRFRLLLLLALLFFRLLLRSLLATLRTLFRRLAFGAV
ncbi:hypothetical protein RFM27_26925 [Mesorhizobium sp. VK23A]|uniref:Secreted peptide n=1 Tax=Mesorhizobium dulcispinae TaxID=3072316 RepID=A0ABU4XLU9_9HYPH|nr:hypothetical protein [Mesorhizobium sp. VK23B]MDX8475722.1 hypothetical protein [Mesorhizobium sp. VK23A]MDX8520315.1 hypothetical protein [Mesorhizobium sp. VK23D]